MIRTGKKFSKPDLSRVINGDTPLPATALPAEKVRLDLLLLQKFPAYNRSTLQTFVQNGFIKVNGETVKKSNAKFPPDANLELTVPEKTPLKQPPKIIYEDENVLVLDKPAGLLSMQKGEYCPEWTLQDFGLLVHRLDRDTSGVVILAKNETTQSFLRRQFQDRKTQKTYLAVVEGCPKLPKAEINLPLARNLNRPTTFRVDPSGKESITFYKTLATSKNPPLTLLELRPKTGRTHQLRVHLAYINTPILGDPVYNPKSQASRLFLHAKSLEITIPGTPNNERKIFTSETPPDFLQFFKN